jgi:ParB/RepB/Spo0J family partition protein
MSTQVENQLLNINLGEIREPDEALRACDRTTEKYLGLVDSIKLQGVLNAISVREIKDPETGDIVYGLVDGLQRYTAAKDAGRETIPAQVVCLDDAEILEAQIIANVHKIETRPIEYSKALVKVLQENPLMTRSELAAKLAKTSAWISERMGLLKLNDQIQALVDSGDIGLSNAYALAKLPEEEQNDFADRALGMAPTNFASTVAARAKEIRDAKREGRAAGPAEFSPVPMLKSRKDLENEIDSQTAAEVLVAQVGITDPVDAFTLALSWALTLDPTGVEFQKARDDERKAENERRKEINKVERTKKRAKEAAEKATKLQKEADEVSGS